MSETTPTQRETVSITNVGGALLSSLGFWLFVLLLYQFIGLYWGLWEIQNHYAWDVRPFTPYTTDSDRYFKPWVEEEVAAPAVAPGEVSQPEAGAVSEGEQAIPATGAVPAPLNRTAAQKVILEATTREMPFEVADGVTTDVFTFGGQIPGPFYRVQVGDTVEYHLKNDENSVEDHSTDFHWVTGPGGGATVLQTVPGEESVAQFKALAPGLYLYHCASGDIPMHIASGMYGLTLVEPEGGLAPVDREYSIVQSEWYLAGNEPGHWDMAREKAEVEEATYVVFNGRVGALMGDNALKAKVGETVRLYVGNIGPNYVSSFHIIGEMFDRVYQLGSLTSEPLHDVQTVLIPAGGTAIVEITFEVPGSYLLVDHSIFRLDKGAVGQIVVEGAEAPDIYSGSK